MSTIKKYVSLDKLGLYDEKIKKVITDADAAALQAAKDYADGLAGNYEAAGSVNTAKTELEGKITAEENRAKGEEARIEGLVTKAQGEVDALEEVVDTKAAQAGLDALAGKVGTVEDGKTVMGIINEIQENAYDDTAIVARIEAVETNKADKTQVATDIAAAVKVETDARVLAVQGVQDAVDALEEEHGKDKKALEDELALKATIEALNDVSAVANAAVKQADYDEKVKALEDEDARIAGLVATEKERAEGIEADHKTRIEKMEAFFDGAAEDSEGLNDALNTLVEIQTYVNTHGEAAAKMVEEIAANAKAIEDHGKIDHDFAAADATLKTELEGKINAKADKTTVEGIDGRLTTAEGKITTVEGKVSTLEGKMTDVEGDVATKAEAQALADAVEALEGADATLLGKIEALEDKFDGDDSVSNLIATAKQEAIDTAAGDATTKANKALEDAKKYADEEDAKIETRVDTLEAASATHALASDLTALGGRVTTAEGEIDTLQTEMTAVQALADAADKAAKANAQAIALKADATALTYVSDRVGVLETWHNNFTEASEAEILELFN